MSKFETVAFRCGHCGVTEYTKIEIITENGGLFVAMRADSDRHKEAMKKTAPDDKTDYVFLCRVCERFRP